RAEGDAKRARKILCLPEMGRIFVRQTLEQRLIRTCFANSRLIKEHESLQIDFPDADLRRKRHECWQFFDSLLQAGEPDGDLRLSVSLSLLQFAKRAHVSYYAAEIIFAPNGFEGLAVRCIERYAKLVEFGRDQRASVPFTEDSPVGVEQNVDAAVLQVSDHARQVCDQHRLADTMQHRSHKIGHLIDNQSEQFPAHVRRRLEFLVGARTRGAQQIATIGHFQINAYRRTGGNLGALALYRFVVAAWIDARVNGRIATADAHCDRPKAVVCFRYAT